NGLGAHRRILPSARAMYSRHRALSQRSSGARLRRPLPRTISNHAPTVRRNSEAKLDSGPNSFHRAAKSREEATLGERVVLPPFLEPERDRILAGLQPID